MEYTLTITSSDPKELAALLSGISGGSAAPAPVAPVKKTPAAAPAKAEPETATDEGDSAPKITKETLRELTTQKAQANVSKNPAKIKAILKELGAENVASLKEEHYASYHEKVSAL